MAAYEFELNDGDDEALNLYQPTEGKLSVFEGVYKKKHGGNHYLMASWGRPDLRDITTLDDDIYLFREENVDGVFALVVNKQSGDKIVDVSAISNTEHFINELECTDEMLDGG